jgi:hypothetical protein
MGTYLPGITSAGLLILGAALGAYPDGGILAMKELPLTDTSACNAKPSEKTRKLFDGGGHHMMKSRSRVTL